MRNKQVTRNWYFYFFDGLVTQVEIESEINLADDLKSLSKDVQNIIYITSAIQS